MEKLEEANQTLTSEVEKLRKELDAVKHESALARQQYHYVRSSLLLSLLSPTLNIKFRQTTLSLRGPHFMFQSQLCSTGIGDEASTTISDRRGVLGQRRGGQ